MATVEVTRLRPPRSPVAVIRESSPWVDTEVSSVASNRVVVFFRLRENPPPGRYRVEFTLATPNPEDPVCTLNGEIANPEDIEVFPPRLQVEPIARPQFRTLWLRQNGALTWRLEDVRASSPRVRLRLDASGSLRDLRLQVECSDLQDALRQEFMIEMRWRGDGRAERWTRVPMRVSEGGTVEDWEPGTENAMTHPVRAGQ
jgi:hypothetical protein